MSTFKQRLIDEKQDLDAKITKLEVFLKGVSFQEIKAEQQTLLNIQIKAMETYSQILAERIAWLNEG